MEKKPLRAPVCTSCHMPKGTHNISFGIVYDSWGYAVDKNGKAFSQGEKEKIRKQMAEGVCYQCHIPSVTEERFELADRVKEQTRSILAEAEKVIRDLEAEGILSRGVTLGRGQLYQGTPGSRGSITACSSSTMSTSGRELTISAPTLPTGMGGPICRCRLLRSKKKPGN